MKHIYMFYQKMATNLDPIFVAWTDNQETATKFMKFRKGFYLIEKDVEMEDIDELRNSICEKNEIVEYKFHTAMYGLKRTVPMMATLREVYEITLHKESTAMKFLSACINVSPSIFSKEIKDALTILGYFNGMFYVEDLPVEGGLFQFPITSSLSKCSIDELSLFLLMNEKTVRDVYKKKE